MCSILQIEFARSIYKCHLNSAVFSCWCHIQSSKEEIWAGEQPNRLLKHLLPGAQWGHRPVPDSTTAVPWERLRMSRLPREIQIKSRKNRSSACGPPPACALAFSLFPQITWRTDKQQVSQRKLLLPSCDCPLCENRVSCQGHPVSGAQSLNAVFIP